MEKTPLKIEDIIIGKPLEWSAVDKNGKELLKEGSSLILTLIKTISSDEDKNCQRHFNQVLSEKT